MTFIQHNGIRYYQFDSLQTRHALFTRHGGVSPDPWGSLNVGGTVGDDLGRVRENRVLSFQALNCEPESIFDEIVFQSCCTILAMGLLALLTRVGWAHSVMLQP